LKITGLKNNYMKLSCKKASILIDKKSVDKLSIKEWINLKIHLSMCDICSLYQKQSKLIEKVLISRLNEVKLSKENEIENLKDSIKSKLKDLK